MIRRIIALLAALVLLVGIASAGSDLGLSPTSTQVYSGTLENWAAGGIQLPNGSYIVAWQHSPSESSNSGVVYSSISSDFGATWSSPITLVSNSTYAISEPQFAIFNNTLFLFYDTTNAASSGNPSARYVMASTDGGSTWGSPTMITSGAYLIRGSQNPINMSSGRIVLPGFIYNTSSTKYEGIVYYSDNNCTSWTTGGGIIHPTFALSEPTIIQFSNNTLMALIRNTSTVGGLYQFKSLSTDGGQSWSVPESSWVVSPRAQAAAIKTSAGRIALIWNNVSSSANTPRVPLTVSITPSDFSTIGNYTAIRSGTGQWSNFGAFVNSSGEIVVPYSDEINWRIYVTSLKESDFFPTSPSPNEYLGHVLYYYNVTSGAGAQTNYQMRFTLSNASGVSGYYPPNNIIYTNGSTRPDWADVYASDEFGNPVPFWIENHTTTANNCTAWVNVPSIAVSNASIGEWHFGNASQTASYMNGYATFPEYDDFIASSVNSTKWNTTGSITQNGDGNIRITSPGASESRLLSRIPFSVNTSLRAYMRSAHYASTSYREVMEWKGTYTTNANFCNEAAGYEGRYRNSNSGGTNLTPMAGWSADTMGVIEIARFAGSTNNSVNDANSVKNTGNVYTGTQNISFTTYAASSNVTVDWAFVRNIVYPEPITSSYTTTSDAVVAPVAAFICTPTNVTLGVYTACTDLSSNNPDTWLWDFGDGNTSTTQNPSYTYPAIGTYNVSLWVNNTVGGDWENKTSYITVTNASGFTPQDVWMEGQYTQMFSVTDSSTGLPIAGVLIDDLSGQQNTTIANGTGWITEGFGSYAILFTATGYTPKQVTYVFDQDESHDVQLTPASSSTVSKSTWYTPHQVQFIAVDSNYKKLPDVTIEATAIANTFPAGTDWLVSMYGMDADAANQIMNGTLVMSGDTGTDGAIVFTMLSSIQYNVTLTEPTTGVTTFTKIYPKDPSYTVRMVGVASAANNTYTDMGYNQSLWVYEPNASYVTMNMSYQDMSGRTSLVEYYAYNKSNSTYINYQSVANPGTSAVKLNFTVKNDKFVQYAWWYNAVRTV